MFEKYLQEIGLNEKEAAIYLSLLSVDNDSVAEIAKKTKIKRPTVYFILDGLKKKGLVSEVQAGKIVHFAAEPPERLETFVERQKTVFEERAARLKDIIPQIKSVQREQGERPVIKFFEGRDGAISAYTEFYSFDNKEKKEGYFVLNVDLLNEVFTEKEIAAFREIRKGKQIEPIVIYNKRGEHDFGSAKAVAKIDGDRFPITTDIAIVDDRVIISTLGSTVSSMVIQSKDVAETLKSLIKKIAEK